MKSLLILILTATLCAGAFLSRPTEQSFREMVEKKVAAAQEKDDLLKVILRGGKGRTDAFLASCKYHDRLLWASVERDGKTIYTGAFSTWFARDVTDEKAE